MLGRIAGVFGVKGWVKLVSHTRPRQAIFDYSPWRIGFQSGWQRRAVLAGEARGKGLVAHVEGIEDRDLAAGLIGTEIAIPRDELPPAEQGDFYWSDLEGCTVINQAGIKFGAVTGLMETGANDVLVVKNGRQRLIPYVDDVIEKVDLETRCIRVNWEEDF